MVLAIAPTTAEAEKLRRTFAKMHSFAFCATYDNMVRAADKYDPNGLLVFVPEISDVLVKKLKRICESHPDIGIVLFSDLPKESLAVLPHNACFPLHSREKTLQYQALYFSFPSPQSSAFHSSYIISGLLMVPLDRKVFLCGEKVAFSPEEVFLLRYLAEIHPRRASVQELGAVCFTYGKKTPRSTVAARISRINNKAKHIISTPILTYKQSEGYGIDF